MFWHYGRFQIHLLSKHNFLTLFQEAQQVFNKKFSTLGLLQLTFSARSKPSNSGREILESDMLIGSSFHALKQMTDRT